MMSQHLKGVTDHREGEREDKGGGSGVCLPPWSPPSLGLYALCVMRCERNKAEKQEEEGEEERPQDEGRQEERN